MATPRIVGVITTMVKLRDDSITSGDILEYVESQDDLGLELAVYSYALHLKLAASHGGTYEDPITGKHRQFDVRIAVRHGDQAISLAVECKNLRPNFPLVVSTVPRTYSEAYYGLVHSSTKYLAARSSIHQTDPAQITIVRDQASLYPVGLPVGKSTAQVGRNDRNELVSSDSEVFEKWGQALSSLNHLAVESLYHYEQALKGGFLTALFPVLVVSDGNLWTANYSEGGKLVAPPLQCDSTTVFVDRMYKLGLNTQFVATHLHIFTKSGFTKFLDDLASRRRAFSRIFSPAIVIE